MVGPLISSAGQKTKPGSVLRSRTENGCRIRLYQRIQRQGAVGHPATSSVREKRIRPHRKLFRSSSVNLLVIPKTSFSPMVVSWASGRKIAAGSHKGWAQYNRSAHRCPISYWNTWLYIESITQAKRAHRYSMRSIPAVNRSFPASDSCCRYGSPSDPA